MGVEKGIHEEFKLAGAAAGTGECDGEVARAMGEAECAAPLAA